MAEWELSPAFTKVRKRLGNMVFYEIDGIPRARKRPSRREKNSPAQDEVNTAFGKVGGDWKYLEGIIQASWDAIADRKKRKTGYSLFVGANTTPQRKGEPLALSRPLGEQPLAGFRAQPGNAAGEINCEFAWSAANAGKHVTFFIQKKEKGLAAGEIVRVDGGADPVSPYTLNGFEPGSEYFVYALVTDRAYGEAQTVSIARGAISSAAV